MTDKKDIIENLLKLQEKYPDLKFMDGLDNDEFIKALQKALYLELLEEYK